MTLAVAAVAAVAADGRQPRRATVPVNQIVCGDALEVLRTLPDACVDAIVTDPPYFRVKGEAWDRQWQDARAFLAWLATIANEWRRVLKPNGSLYCFASPQMAARVEVMLGERFHILNQLVWRKRSSGGGGGWGAHAHKESLRGYFPNTERIIFAEQYGADSMALGESGYAAQCEQLHGFVFEPLRAYLDGERKRAGIGKADCNAACGFARIAGGMASRHYFSRSQWCLPTEAHYTALQRLFNAGSPSAAEYLRRDYEYLRRDYEELRRDYEYLRRPFAVSADVPYTDVWDFETVAWRPGKHPCEKPLDMMRHIVRSSTRPDALVLDCFAGSGATLEAAHVEGRHYLGIERDARYVAQARHRLNTAAPHLVLMAHPTTQHTQHTQQPQQPQHTQQTPQQTPQQQPERIIQRSMWEHAS